MAHDYGPSHIIRAVPRSLCRDDQCQTFILSLLHFMLGLSHSGRPGVSPKSIGHVMARLYRVCIILSCMFLSFGRGGSGKDVKTIYNVLW